MFDINKIDRQSTLKIFTKTFTPQINDNFFINLKKWDEIVYLGLNVVSELGAIGQTLRYKFNTTEFSTWTLNTSNILTKYCNQFINSTTVNGYINTIPNNRFHFLCLENLSIYLKASANLSGSIRMMIKYIDKGV